MEQNKTMKQAFQYNLIRFQPDAETEEFAVIGIVAYSPATQQLAYRLVEKDQCQRIHDFFHPLDEQVLPAALQMIETELNRVQKLLPNVKRPTGLYEELVREREDIIRFAPAGTMLGNNAQHCADELFERYVKRHYSLAA